MIGQNLTTGSEVTAYLVAHAIGIVSTYVLNPMIYMGLNGAGRQGFIPAVGLGMSLVTMVFVLFLFLFMRRAFSNQS
jgi:ABC-type polysaccharide transport system permease subunit